MIPLINVPFDWYLHVAELACLILSFRLNKAYQLQSIKPRFTTDNQHVSAKVSPRLPGEPSLKCYTHMLFRLQWSNKNPLSPQGNFLHGLKLLCWQEQNINQTQFLPTSMPVGIAAKHWPCVTLHFFTIYITHCTDSKTLKDATTKLQENIK